MPRRRLLNIFAALIGLTAAVMVMAAVHLYSYAEQAKRLSNQADWFSETITMTARSYAQLGEIVARKAENSDIDALLFFANTQRLLSAASERTNAPRLIPRGVVEISLAENAEDSPKVRSIAPVTDARVLRKLATKMSDAIVQHSNAFGQRVMALRDPYVVSQSDQGFWLIWPYAKQKRALGARFSVVASSSTLDAYDKDGPTSMRLELVAPEAVAKTRRQHWTVEKLFQDLMASEELRAPILGQAPTIMKRSATFGDHSLQVTFERNLTGALTTKMGVNWFAIAVSALVGVMLFFMMRRERARARTLLRSHSNAVSRIAQKQTALDESEARFKHLAESTNLIPWTAELSAQKFTYVGPQVEALTGFPAESWRAPGFWADHIHPDDRRRLIFEEVPKLKPNQYATLEYRIRAANGRVAYIRNMLTILEDPKRKQANGKPALVGQGFFLDVTEMRRAEAALEDARTRAEEANRVKSEFLATMSHELRTPLNAVIGFSEIMKDEILGPLDPNYAEYAQSIYTSGKHLLDLINDVLDLSKIEAGRIELLEEETDLSSLLNTCRRLLTERAESSGLKLNLEAPAILPSAKIDQRRVKQVLLNLMSNAIKFTPPGGSVTVSAEHQSGCDLRICVSDTGVGMSEDEIPKALEKFGQIDGELSRQHDGTGLGLPIAKSLIEMHGGMLEIASAKGKGTDIIITLPENRLIHAAA